MAPRSDATELISAVSCHLPMENIYCVLLFSGDRTPNNERCIDYNCEDFVHGAWYLLKKSIVLYYHPGIKEELGRYGLVNLEVMVKVLIR